MQKEIKTSLQTINADIKEVLEWKQLQLTEKNLPVEAGIADYIFMGMNGIDEDIKQLTDYKALIDSQIKQAKENKERTSKDIAKWIESQGVDKLNGIAVSSITITKGKAESEETIITKSFKCDLDQQELQDFLIKHVKGRFIAAESIKVTKATEDKIRVNQKKG